MPSTDSPQTPPAQQGKSLAFYLIGIALAVATGFAGMLTYDLLHQEPAHATVLPTQRAVAPFSLTDHEGNSYSNADLQGKWTILFFGFTHCPDVCPGSLIQLAKVADELGDNMPEVMLVSVDPQRDSSEKLASYINHFHPEFRASTGPDEALKPLTTSLGVAWNIIPTGDNGEYTVDHTAWLMLINPQGNLMAYFSPPLLADNIASDLRRILP